ncbi:hypothetical protein R6Q59_033869 [Mikania micrantha]
MACASSPSRTLNVFSIIVSLLFFPWRKLEVNNRCTSTASEGRDAEGVGDGDNSAHYVPTLEIVVGLLISKRPWWNMELMVQNRVRLRRVVIVGDGGDGDEIGLNNL